MLAQCSAPPPNTTMREKAIIKDVTAMLPLEVAPDGAGNREAFLAVRASETSAH